MKYNNDKYEILSPEGFVDFLGVQKLQRKTIEISFSNNLTLRGSLNHTIFDFDNHPIELSNIKIGDSIKSFDGNLVVVDILNYEDETDVYDIIDSGKLHLYYTNKIISHNCNFLGSGDNVFDSLLMQKVKDNYIKEPQNKMMGNSLWIWKEPVMGHKYVMGCLPPGEKVLTNFGLKNIEDVTFNELLVNETGNYVNIINKQIYPVIDEDIYTIKVDNTFRTTTFTKEHPILISKTILKRNYKKNNKDYQFNERYWDFDFKYVKTEDIEVGDWIKVPNQYFNKKIENIDNYWKISEKVRTDFNISSPLNNKEFWWFIGMWLGDGWLEQKNDNYLIGICFDKKQKSYLYEMEKIIFKLFNRNPTYIDKESSDNLVFNSKFLYYFLLENFGRYSYGKMISEWVKTIPNEFKYELIRGYFDSDGCWVKVKKKDKYNSKLSFVSISLTLLESIQDILFSIGIISSLNLLRNLGEITFKNKLYKTKETYSLNLGNNDSLELLRFINNKDDIKLQKFNINEFSIVNKRIISSCHFNQTKEFIFFRVKNIKKNKFTGNVYNFECETNTFMCHHITTHNCDVSRGDSEDFSAFQIIDFDEREQVAEYVGKLPPDTMAEICYKWANMYNCFIVIDITGGMGVSTSRKLQEMGYKNLYVDGVDLANKWKYDPKTLDKIPGLNFNNKRVQIIASFEEAMRHEFKIYSSRLFDEMNTFIYVSGRPDHQKGQHDDLIMSIAMATYVAESSFSSLEKVTEQTKAMLESWSVSNNENMGKQLDFNPVIPFGHERINQRNQNVSKDDYMKYSWLFGR